MCRGKNPITSEQDLPPPYEATWSPSYQAPASPSDKDPASSSDKPTAPSSDKAPPPPVDSGAQNVVEAPTDRGTHPQQQPVDQAVRLQQQSADALAADGLIRLPMSIECPRCHAQVITYVKSRLGVKNVLGAIVVGVAAPPLFWLPLVMPGTHRRIHYCPKCDHKIGRGHRKNQVVYHTDTPHAGVSGFI
ncbi:hypothetical protein IWQ57_001067 [Coemansia nantahalensis]|uniref:Uncharacterized protein n=1 Tax=Coemansia nantahalensis TaxID=2789366 RepID=A0ACC1K5P7_9FUNG|nr:hypothetical protein IWQ57_001067 [Coemansia nantahalensis]